MKVDELADRQLLGPGLGVEGEPGKGVFDRLGRESPAFQVLAEELPPLFEGGVEESEEGLLIRNEMEGCGSLLKRDEG